MIILLIILLVLFIASFWRIYEKAGEPGWASIVPIYNIIVWMRIINKPWWWLLLFIIPLVGIIFSIWATNLLMKKFGKDELWTVGAIFIPFIIYPMLAWGNAEYQGAGERDAIGSPEILDSGL
jgi:hypothetical protein